MRSEKEFIDSIDCRFPFDDREQAVRLIDEGCRISANAAFALVDEITRPGHSVVTSNVWRTELLRRLFDQFEHPLVAIIRPIAEGLVAGVELSAADAIVAMRAVAAYPDQDAALGIPYFAADDDSHGTVDLEYQRIRTLWDAV